MKASMETQRTTRRRFFSRRRFLATGAVAGVGGGRLGEYLLVLGSPIHP